MNRLSAEEFSTRYAAWIAKNKIEITSLSGMDVQRDQLHPRLRGYQKDAVLWALRIGHGLIAAKFGLGKTTMQMVRMVTGMAHHLDQLVEHVRQVTAMAQTLAQALGVSLPCPDELVGALASLPLPPVTKPLPSTLTGLQFTNLSNGPAVDRAHNKKDVVHAGIACRHSAAGR